MIGFLLFAALQQPVSPELELQIALRLYQGERVSSSVTTGKNDTVSGSIWADASMCGVGSSETASSGPDRIRWQYTARILQRSSSSYTVEIEWQRDGGPFGSAARTTQQFVLQLGQPQVLDTLTPATANACGVTTLRVDASIVPASPQDFRRFGSGGGGGRGAGASAGGFGTSAAAGGGAGRGRGFGGTAVASGGTATIGGGRGGRGSGGVNGAGALANAPGGARGDWLIGGNGSALEFARMLSQGNYAWNYRVSSAAAGAGIGAARGGGSDMTVTTGGGRGVAVGPTWVFSPPNPPLTPISTGSYDAELWLVHTPPGGKEETQRVTVHVGPDGDAVAFPLVTVSTPNGPTTVDVAVALRVMADEKGANVLRVIIVRRVDGGTIASASGSSASASTGATTKVIPLPAANDTVSFELPQARAFATSALADHPFSVRLRIGAGK